MIRILITSAYKYFQSRIPPKFRQTNMTQLWNYLLQNLKLLQLKVSGDFKMMLIMIRYNLNGMYT